MDLLEIKNIGQKSQITFSSWKKKQNDYNFTADESTSLDVEISLDPELLGHIFENLLAIYNPETRETARKLTGSYYTPIEVVELMVEKSIMEYLKDKTYIDYKRLEEQVCSENVPKLSDEEKVRLVNAIDTIKVIDSAVGSGAFPIGILRKLIRILEKIDPENILWKDQQMKKIMINNEMREELFTELNENFDQSLRDLDYARKLYIIQNSIYGVDIQSIAIQITKLRFFLSLLVDQKIDPSKENFGIKPLPHLETNFVCANTLMKLNRPKQGKFMPVGFEKLKGELLNLYKKHFSIRTRQEKKHIQEKAMKIREQIKEMLKKSGWSNDEAKKIANFDIFDQLEQADWFDSEWMFGVNNFDIVIGNPPYVRQEKLKDKKDTFITSNKWIRVKYGKQLRNFLKENAIIEYIIDFAGYKVFESATVDTSIIILKKVKEKKQSIKVAVLDQEVDEGKIKEIISSKMFYINQNKLSDEAYVLEDEEILKLKEKLERVGKPLRDWNVKIYRGILTGLNEAFIIDSKKRQEILDNCKDDEERKRTEKIIKPVLRGRDIGRYYYKWANLWVIYIPWHFPIDFSIYNDRSIERAIIKSEIMFKKLYPALYNYMLSFKDKLLARNKSETGIKYDWYALQRYASEYYQEFEKEKILWQEIVREPSFTIDYRNMYVEASGGFPSYYRGKRAYSFANRESCWQNIGNKSTRLGSRHSRT